MIFEDTEGDKMEVRCCGDGRKVAFEVEDADVFYFTPSDARAVAAEIIACADRIEGNACLGCVEPKCPGDCCSGDHGCACSKCKALSTPTHTSHASLVVFAKAIAYLPAPMRDELNALLAQKLKEALK